MTCPVLEYLLQGRIVRANNYSFDLRAFCWKGSIVISVDLERTVSILPVCETPAH